MSIHQLQVYHFRKLTQYQLQLIPELNVIVGQNGSGKTSLLEALYMLSSGYSFKTRETSPLVQYGCSALTVFSRNRENETVSLRKTISGPTVVKLNGEVCTNNSSLAKAFPCQVFHQDLFQIIDSGPSVRRSLLDWGVFHVKHAFHEVWRNYRHVLKQRNALLRKSPSQKSMVVWDSQLAEQAGLLDKLREEYFQLWNIRFQFYLSQLSDIQCTLQYYRGWNVKKELIELLHEQFSSDVLRQYTLSGAHQADIRIEGPHATAKQGFSRGQQKIISTAMKLAQGDLLERECLYLFDDFTAELDEGHVHRLLNCLNQVKGQKVITALDSHCIKKYTGGRVVNWIEM